ncbi:MAG TPA: hypothetical protein VEG64_07770 [Candidatus Sulfotelmatobacter sp.]|nr:hypothetical protein [Candidatus Sulfotelmatobacter sp.]
MVARAQFFAAILLSLIAGLPAEPGPQSTKQAPPAAQAAPPQPAAPAPPANPPCPQTPQPMHRVTVKFDYDFSKSPLCTKKIKRGCVAQFVLYDVSVGVPKRTKLATIPAPNGASGIVPGITWTTDCLVFEPGQHRLAVRAQDASGAESRVKQCDSCTTIIEIP